MKRFFLCLIILQMAYWSTAPAQDVQPLPHPKVPLEQLLNRDGTLDLNRNFQGSLDPSGWQMTTGPNGEPRFVPANAAQHIAGAAQPVTVPGDENWDDRFGITGPNAAVYAITVNGSEMYVGGGFTAAGGVAASHIAKWDGTSWSALGSGTNGDIYAIVVNGSEVYVAGNFRTAGGVVVNNIAKWDGTSWSGLGDGMNSEVRAVVLSGSELYAGGYFTTAGGTSANYIAKWNGTSWSALGSGLNGVVYAIAVSGSEVYVGGAFSYPGSRIAKWNGTSWSALGSGMNSLVLAIAVSGGEVYAGGWFTTAGGVAANFIAKWSNASWSSLGTGMSGYVRAIAISNGEVYVGGYFGRAGAVSANSIAKWDGANWSALGGGVDNYAYAIAVNGGEVYAGGDFITAGGVAANYIAKWNGTSWSRILNVSNQYGLNASALAITLNGSEVYVGGYFTTAAGVSENRIAKWDGSSWSALGSGMSGGIGGAVTALAISGSEVYAGGYFTSAGGVTANFIAKWNGTSWSALGGGMNGVVNDVAVSGSEVYAAGNFTTAGGVAANYIAKWDGSSWSALGNGMNSWVNAIAISGGEVYAGGAFTYPASYIAKWNGSSWSSLGSGMNHYVYALAVSGGEVYAGGNFYTAGGVAAAHIAKWNGTSWATLGTGIVGSVRAIVVSGGEVYVGGHFTGAGGVAANHIAKWNGTSWSALGSGMNNWVHALAVSGGEVYAGGDFTAAGGKTSSYFGRYVLNTPPTVAAGGPYSVSEGAFVTVSASGNDPENGPLTYVWDLDNNGSFETAGQSVTFSAANLDGPGNHNIRVQVTDNGSLTATAQTTVTVLNVAPTATFTGTPSTILVGQSAALALSNQADPSAADVTAGFTYSYDCTNDGTFEISDVTVASYACAYPASGTFTAKGRIQDKDGGLTDYTVQVIVLTPQDAIRNLINQVLALNKPQGNGLINGKLDVAIKRLDNNEIDKAIDKLQDFIKQVNVFMKNGTFTIAEGQPLIDAAEAIIAALSNPAQATAAGLKRDASEGLATSTSGLPTEFQLAQNSPNPFNPTTTIQFSVPRDGFVRLKVYNSFGAEVATLVDRQIAAGSYKINWNASHLASGIYLYRLEAEGFAQSKRLLLMK